MITEGIVGVLFGLVDATFLVLPDISWSVDSGAMGTFLDFIRVVLYFFPMSTVIMIIGIVLSITGFRIAISIVKSIWDLLPFV